jgi:hypothetical protein
MNERRRAAILRLSRETTVERLPHAFTDIRIGLQGSSRKMILVSFWTVSAFRPHVLDRLESPRSPIDDRREGC